MRVSIKAWCRDCFNMNVDGESIVENYYVPLGIGIGGGDAVNLDIDVETGKIIGWNPELIKNFIKMKNGDN